MNEPVLRYGLCLATDQLNIGRRKLISSMYRIVVVCTVVENSYSMKKQYFN